MVHRVDYRLALGLAILFFMACEWTSEPEAVDQPGDLEQEHVQKAYIEKGDLKAIRQRGHLRLLIPRAKDNPCLPHCGLPLDSDIDLAYSFAESIGVEPQEVYMEFHDDLIPALLAGKGDIIVASLSVTETRKKKVAFSSPLMAVHEQIVVREDENLVNDLDDLKGRRIAQRKSSSYWETLAELKKDHTYLELEPVGEHLDTMNILQGLAAGTFDVAMADSNLVQEFLAFNEGVKPAFNLGEEKMIAWALRPDSLELLEALNTFLGKSNVGYTSRTVYRDDFSGIKKRGVLRMITRNSAATYFIWRGKILGFEYELVNEFAKRWGLRVEIIVPPKREDLIPWLKQGRGDVIAASLTISDDLVTKQGVAFTGTYNKVSEILVARAHDNVMTKVEDLNGRTVVVRPSSSYRRTLEKLKARGINLTIQDAPEDMETEEIIAQVATGAFDLTVSDSHILDIELTWRDDVKGAFALGEAVDHGWVVRPENEELLKNLNAYLKSIHKSLFYNMTHRKYFQNERKIKTLVENRVKNKGELSPYDDLVKKYAEKYGFDWRLIVSQMYQESKFNPNAKSFAGALGLMQVLPRTARFLGFKNITHPETGLHAGVKYLDSMRRYFGPELPVEDRNWFLLASYNAGHGHVFDARRLAGWLGLNPNRWFGNVEKAMLLLSKPKYARQAKYGYCRGSEPVKYVREIRRRYRSYVRAAEE